MTPSILPQGDMERKPNPRLIPTTMPTTHQMRLHSEPATSSQREDQAKFTEIESQAPNSQEKRLLVFTSTSRTKQIYMDQGNPYWIIALAMWWTQPFGTAQAGQPRKIPIPIKIEPNTENNSINQSLSIRETWNRVPEKSATRISPMSQEIWELLDSEETNLIIRDSKRPAEGLRMVIQSTLTTIMCQMLRRNDLKNKDLTRNIQVNISISD